MLDVVQKTASRAELVRAAATWRVRVVPPSSDDRVALLGAVAACMGVSIDVLYDLNNNKDEDLAARAMALAGQGQYCIGYDSRCKHQLQEVRERKRKTLAALYDLGEALLPGRSGGVEKVKFADIALEALGLAV